MSEWRKQSPCPECGRQHWHSTTESRPVCMPCALKGLVTEQSKQAVRGFCSKCQLVYSYWTTNGEPVCPNCPVEEKQPKQLWVNRCLPGDVFGPCVKCQTYFYYRPSVLEPICGNCVPEAPGSQAPAQVKGHKADKGKPRWDLLPLDALNPLVRVLTHGAVKYGDNNWQQVPEARARYFAACLRHLTAYQSGEICDPESGESHLAHAMACLLFLSWFELRAKEKP